MPDQASPMSRHSLLAEEAGHLRQALIRSPGIVGSPCITGIAYVERIFSASGILTSENRMDKSLLP